MGSSYFGEPNMMRNERSSSGGSSKKGKKSNSDKPKQPQRGLGVAQLEKIRLHGQMDCSYQLPDNSLQIPYPSSLNLQDDLRVQTAYSAIPSSFSYSSATSSASCSFHPNMMMGFSEMERTNIRYGDSPPSAASSVLENPNFAQPDMTRHLLNLRGEEVLQNKRKKNRSDSMGSGSQNSRSSDTQELDLDLRLSL